MKGKIESNSSPEETNEFDNTNTIPYSKNDSHQQPSHQFPYTDNYQNPYLNTSQCPYPGSDQLPYPTSDQPMTNLLKETSDDNPEGSGRVHGWNMELLEGWEIKHFAKFFIQRMLFSRIFSFFGLIDSFTLRIIKHCI